jgi:carboxyl-terminal processing protease
VSRADEPIDTELALLTFDSAWSRINSSYYDPDFRGLDWEGIRDELRPSVAEVETLGELRRILSDMLSRLGESHFAILPQEGVDGIDVGDDGVSADTDAGDLGMEVRWVEGELTVFRVQEGAAREAGVRPGWIVEAIDDREISRWQEAIASADSEIARARLSMETVQGAGSLMGGSAGSAVTLRLRDGDDRVRTLTLERQPVRGRMVRFGQLPAMPAFLDYERVPAGDACVGVISFNIWMIPLVADFNQAVDALADCRGMVIDIRGNLGGVGGMVMGTAGSFFSERADLGVVQSRTGEMRFVAMPRGVDTSGELRDAFTGPLAILIDEQSMSTSEIFAAGLKSTGRARVFGTTSPGYALPAMTLRLPSQDVLYHVISNLTDPEGERIEGQGVVPDEVVPLRRAELLAGRDAALEAAIAWASSPGAQAPAR